MSKIFGIGLVKTGTTSLGASLVRLGYKHLTGFFTITDKYIPHLLSGNYDPIFELARTKESFEDLPWCSPGFYKLLDKEFPGSKFILTIRDSDNWLRSFKREYSPDKPSGLVQFVQATFDMSTDDSIKSTYEKHNHDAQEYFKDRNDLLVVNWEKGDGWKEICSFLDKPLRNEPFPHMNPTQEK